MYTNTSDSPLLYFSNGRKDGSISMWLLDVLAIIGGYSACVLTTFYEPSH